MKRRHSTAAKAMRATSSVFAESLALVGLFGEARAKYSSRLLNTKFLAGSRIMHLAPCPQEISEAALEGHANFVIGLHNYSSTRLSAFQCSSCYRVRRVISSVASREQQANSKLTQSHPHPESTAISYPHAGSTVPHPHAGNKTFKQTDSRWFDR